MLTTQSQVRAETALEAFIALLLFVGVMGTVALILCVY